MALTRPRYSQIYDTDWKNSARVATTADVGNLFLGNAQPNTIDGVSLNFNDRILVKDQTRPFENGLYWVLSVGTGSNGWWSRTLDTLDASRMNSGMTVEIEEGTVSAGREYKLITANPIAVGTTHLTFSTVSAQPSGANTYVQFYDQLNSMGGSAGFTFNKTGNAVVVSGNVTVANLIIPNGSGQFSGFFNESIATAGVFVGNAGSGLPTPRVGFFNGNASQNWQIDNQVGSFRWYLPGALKMSLDPSGNLTVYGSVLPSANIAYDLGSPTQRFRTGYFSANTIDLGGSSISVTATGFSFNAAGTTTTIASNGSITSNTLTAPTTTVTGNLALQGNLVVGGSQGTSGQILQATGTGVAWVAASAGTQMTYGTSNVAILSSGGNVVITVGGSIIANVGTSGLTVLGGISAGTITGNGAALTGLPAGYSNVQTATYLASGTLSTVINTTGITQVANTNNATGGVSGALQVSGGAYIAKDLWVIGNVYAGNLMSTIANVLTTQNNLLYLQNANTYPYTYSIGMYGHFIGGPANAYVHTALTRQPNDNTWWFISNIAEPSPATGNINVYDSNRILDNIVAGNINLTGNIIASAFIGNGAGLTGLPAGYSNVNASTYFASGTASGYINTTGNISAAQANFGNAAIAGGSHTGINAIAPAGNAAVTLGTLTNQWSTIYGRATTAQYADLAENYKPDQDYEPGTVLVFGGQQEVMQSHSSHDTRIAGVVSTNPAYLMNSTLDGVSVALTGRVPCQVLGPVEKGDRVVSSHIAGVAQRLEPAQYQPGCIIGKALEDHLENTVKTIEVVVGRV